MRKFLTKAMVGLGAVGGAVLLKAKMVAAAAIDYASSTGAVDDITANMGNSLTSIALKVIGIAAGLFLIFWGFKKVRQLIK
jgi:uncharacterized membrane protein